MLFDRVERVLDEFRLIANNGDLKVLGQGRHDIGHSLLDRIDQSDRVCTGLLSNGESNGRIIVERIGARRILTCFQNAADLTELDRKTVLRRDDDVVEFFDVGKLAYRSKADRLCSFNKRAAGHFLVLRRNCRCHLIDRKPVCPKFVGIDVKFYLLRPTAEHDDLANAIGRFYLLLDKNLDHVAQFTDIARRTDRIHQYRR